MSNGVTRRGFFTFCGAATATTLFPALELPVEQMQIYHAAGPSIFALLEDIHIGPTAVYGIRYFSGLAAVIIRETTDNMNRPSFSSSIFNTESIAPCPSTNMNVPTVSK